MARVLIAVLLVGLAGGVASAGGEFVAQVDDFVCLTDGIRPPDKNFFIFHGARAKRAAVVRKTRRIAKAIERGRLPKIGKGYPKGTILQLFPFEAMAKRGGGFNPDGGGWEYFRLSVAPDGTTQIVERGGPEVRNAVGSCQGCHLNVAARYDSVCEFVVGAEGLGLTDEQIQAAQARDPRCQ